MPAICGHGTTHPKASPVRSNGDLTALGKSRPAGPKVPFPNSHLAELLHLIEGNTKIRNDLISQLKAHFDTVTSKAAIEAKLKEVALRQGKTKDSQWRVKPEAWVRCSPSVAEAFAERCSRLQPDFHYLVGTSWPSTHSEQKPKIEIPYDDIAPSHKMEDYHVIPCIVRSTSIISSHLHVPTSHPLHRP